MTPGLADELRRECRIHFSESPVFAAIIEAALADLDLLIMLASAESAGHEMRMFVASIHGHAIAEPQAEFAAFLPSLGGTRPVDDPAFASVLRSFVMERRASILAAMRERRFIVKTDIRRAVILRCLAAEAWRMMGRPRDYALIDLGCSVGGNLLIDRIAVKDDDSHLRLDLGPGVSLAVARRGQPVPHVELPPAQRRIGIDLYHLDAARAEDRNMLLGYVNPHDTAAFAALKAVLGRLASEPPELRIGNAADMLGPVLAELAPQLPVIVMHSMMIHYLPREVQSRLFALLADEARRRPVARIAMEIAGAATSLTIAAGQQQLPRMMGRAEFDGSWMTWTPHPVPEGASGVAVA